MSDVLPAQVKGRIVILPHGTEESQLEALDRTLKALLHGGPLARDEHGKVIVDVAGFVRAEVDDTCFVVAAITKQGYAQQAIALPS